MYIVILTLLNILAVKALVTLESQCPEVKPDENFDIHKFSDGKYYEIGRYAEKQIEAKGDCVYGTIKTSRDMNSAVLDLHFVENHHDLNFKWKLTYVPETKELKYTHRNEVSGQDDMQIVLHVIYTDNDKYYLLYGCDYNTNKKRRNGELVRFVLEFNLETALVVLVIMEDFWILSKTNKLGESDKYNIDKFLNSTNIIDTSKIFWDHEICRVYE